MPIQSSGNCAAHLLKARRPSDFLAVDEEGRRSLYLEFVSRLVGELVQTLKDGLVRHCPVEHVFVDPNGASDFTQCLFDARL
ncbi:hypothetical protein GA0061101_15520 [Rhizobium lusitanum]|uniref:Uncharacterized protein n=1 Tax=Rhizobium lusitanum TaxID=293958 RepID=A0A1C3XLC9_9HYPH|nr:hypothetical protein GA0061101_15520 [Rhizobium lusitanum]